MRPPTHLRPAGGVEGNVVFLDAVAGLIGDETEEVWPLSQAIDAACVTRASRARRPTVGADACAAARIVNPARICYEGGGTW